MKIRSTLKIPMLNVKVNLIITDQLRKEFDRLVRKYKLELVLEGEAEGVVVPAAPNNIYLLISKDYISHNTVAHEGYHVTQQIIKDRDLMDEETAAWVCGHVSEFIYKSLEKKNIPVTHG